MSTLTSIETTPKRAVEDVNLLVAATRKDQGKFVHKWFSGIQREIYAVELASIAPERVFTWLVGRLNHDKHGIARAIVAYQDPKALKGFDYAEVPNYELMVDQIKADRELVGFTPSQLFRTAIRHTIYPRMATRILSFVQTEVPMEEESALVVPYLPQLDQTESNLQRNHHAQPLTTIDARLDSRGIYAAVPNVANPHPAEIQRPMQVIVDPGLRIAEPPSVRTVPTPRRFSAPPKPSFFTREQAVNQAHAYLKTVKAAEYEIKPAELSVTRALTEILQQERFIYEYPTLRDLEAELQRRNTRTPATEIENMVRITALKVPRLYGVAMAFREYNGHLPEDAPNMSQLVERLDQYTVTSGGETIHPYRWLSAGGFGTVLLRNIQVAELITNKHMRVDRKFSQELGEYLESQKQKEGFHPS